MSTPQTDRLTAALADRYTVTRELGQGGMAAVYLAQYLLAFSCTCRYFCPCCDAQAPRHLDAVAGHDTSRAGAAPTGGAHHPQAAARLLSLSARRLLGEIARVTTRTVTAAIRTLTGERKRAMGIVAC